MFERLSIVFVLALNVVGCKPAEVTSQTAAVAGQGASEKCGVVQRKGDDFSLLLADGQARLIEPQDGASLNILVDAASRKENVCLRADWGVKGAVSIVSAAAIRRPVQKTLRTEECGVVMKNTSGKIILQIVNKNSEQNLNRELEPQDGATTNLLNQYAKSMTEVCIKGDFSDQSTGVLVESQSVIRKVK